MAKVFRSTREIVQEMCDDFKSLTGITLTPDMRKDTNVIKFWTDAGPLSSLYAEIQRTANDIHPQNASEQGLKNHLRARSMPGQIGASSARGQIKLTLTGAATIQIGAQAKRKSDGALYKAIQTGSLAAAGDLTLFFESLETGNKQNIDAIDQPFELVTAITNVNKSCVSVSKFLDGRDLETPAEMASRVIEHDRDDNTGGNSAAYEAWARAASSEVVTARSLRLVRGPDTVDVVITSGTTNIEAAVESGTAVSRLPSAALVATVKAYIDTKNPTTDDVLVKAPVELNFDTTVNFSLYNESVANRQFVESEIRKVWKTYVYLARPADVLSPTDLERAIDRRSGDLIKERNVANFAGAVSKYVVPDDKILVPNAITFGVI